MQEIFKKSAFVCFFFQKVHPLYPYKQFWGAHCIPKHPLLHKIACMFPLHQNVCFAGLYFFAGSNEEQVDTAKKKTPKSMSLFTFLYANSESCKMQDKLFRKLTHLKIKGRNSFT